MRWTQWTSRRSYFYSYSPNSLGDFASIERSSFNLPETSEDGALKIAESIRKAIQSLAIPNIYSNVIPIVTISMGVASLNPTPDSDQLQLIEKADQALYQAKSEGRNRVGLYKGVFT